MAKRTGQKRAKRPAASGLTVHASRANVRAVPRIQNLSTRELAALASHESQKMLGVSAKKAYAMLDKGELRGTVAEAELRMLRFLRGE